MQSIQTQFIAPVRFWTKAILWTSNIAFHKYGCQVIYGFYKNCKQKLLTGLNWITFLLIWMQYWIGNIGCKLTCQLKHGWKMVVFSTNQDEGDCELSSPFSGSWIQNTDKKIINAQWVVVLLIKIFSYRSHMHRVEYVSKNWIKQKNIFSS